MLKVTEFLMPHSHTTGSTPRGYRFPRWWTASKEVSYLLRFYVAFTLQALYIYFYLGFYVAFNTVHVISQRVVGWAEEPVHTVGQGSVL